MSGQINKMFDQNEDLKGHMSYQKRTIIFSTAVKAGSKCLVLNILLQRVVVCYGQSQPCHAFLMSFDTDFLPLQNNRRSVLYVWTILETVF